MRVLLKMKEDETLLAMEVAEIGYNEEDNELWLNGFGDHPRCFSIYNLGFGVSESIIINLYTEGKLDLTNYLAVEDGDYGCKDMNSF